VIRCLPHYYAFGTILSMPSRPSPHALGAFVFLLLGQAVAMGAMAEAPAVSDGERIVRRSYEINGGHDSFSQLRFTFDQGRGKTSEVTLVMAFKRGDSGRDLDYSVIMFNRYPPDKKDVGFLGWFYRPETGKQDEMWLYLPELRLVRRMVHGHGGREDMSTMIHEDQNDEFAISQLNREELMPRWPGLDEHRLLGMDQVDGEPVYMVQSTPRDPKTSSYGKRIQWITRDDALPVRIEYYDEDMTLLKTEMLTWRRVGDAWLWDRVTAVNNVTGARTTLEQTEVRVNLGLPDSLFTKRALTLGVKAFEDRVRRYAKAISP
jgi:hypothetical protein